MSDLESIDGRWWLPGLRDLPMNGMVRLRNGGYQLKFHEPMHHEWIDTKGPDFREPGFIANLQGTVDGEKYTLLHCILWNHPYTYQTVDVRAVVKGAWIDSPEAARFDRMDLQIENLHALAVHGQLHVAHQPPRKSSIPDLISYKPVPDESCDSDGYTYRLRRWVSPFWEFKPDARIYAARESVSVVITSDKPVSIKAWDRMASKFQDLLTFATQQHCELLSLLLSEPDLHTSDGERRYAEVHRPTRRLDGLRAEAKLERDPSPNVEDVPWEILVPRWLEIHERFHAVLGTLLAQRYAPRQYVDNKVVQLVTACEQAYRALNYEEYLVSPEELKRTMRRVGNALLESGEDPQLIAKIRQEVNGRVTLHSRLRAVVDAGTSSSRTLFGSDANEQRWIVAAKNSRNDLAHTGATTRYNSAALGVIARAATGLLELIILRELGVTEDRLDSVIRSRYWPVAGDIERLLPEVKMQG